MTAQRGFTLVETLVALFVFALLVTAAAFILGNSAEAGRQVEAVSAELQGLQRTRAALRADIAQMAPRDSRAPDGSMRPPLASGMEAGGALMAFVRYGPDNPDGEARPAMQYVEWRLTGEGLVRQAARHLDGEEPGAPAILLPGAADAEIAFHYEGAWSDRPLPAAAGEQPALPGAVRLRFDHPRFGAVEQLFLTGTGA